MTPFYTLAALDALIALLATAAVIHQHHVKRPARKTTPKGDPGA